MRKILIANRGEIAVRIIKTAKKMGIKTVAVFSDADTHALHTQLADEAYLIGEAASRDSYLRMDRIADVTRKSGADAIHPGYGFLSENPEFAKKLEVEGIRFIGPSAHSMLQMGSKIKAKQLARKLNVPLVPGTDEPIKDITSAKKIAEQTGYPLLIKASAGGGGKGMRLVTKPEDLETQLKSASSEALASFGDGAVFIEKQILSPRHIEIQILTDQYGNGVYLFERECSIQRRHQKIIEEAPSTCLDPILRDKMGTDALKLALACGYVGAGTVEFLVDENLHYYFLEMNTRLQVEHPVTEMITGLDLVQLQIEIAEGKTLPFKQSDLQIHGHSIELRICAEDPLNNFLPSIGQLRTYQIPMGEGIRVDHGYLEGMEIPLHYDPLIAKLIVHAKNRKEAIHKLKTAIESYEIDGIETTLDYGTFVLNHPEFISGNFDTSFVAKNTDQFLSFIKDDCDNEAYAMMGLKIYLEEINKITISPTKTKNWYSQRKEL
ncbi:MAG: acetyl-CoA carboxylase biotin carboxylase subunit [Saprospiraceae bacterium]|nr:acetyl-CoA carboxylase biotin carboxylase subunit [Saprospiraceae bacterium]